MSSLLIKKNENDYKALCCWEGDVLDRQQVAEKMTSLVASLRSSFVISLDATYGAGKTYFLQNWKKDLETQGYITAYFDAWRNDFSDDPFLPFLASIEQAINAQKEKTSENDLENRLKTAGEFTKKIAPQAVKIMSKSVLRKLLGNDGLEEFKDLMPDDLEKDIISGASEAVSKALALHLEEQKCIDLFKLELQKYVQDLTFDKKVEQKKIIILVDELDRCKPTYAVKVLERIKHFFSVEGVVFVLGVNEKQITNAMTVVYGGDLDTDGYLRRFIDLKLNLPQPNAINYATVLIEQYRIAELDCLSSQSEYEKNDKQRDSVALGEHFGVVAEALNFSLRQQEQFFTEVNLYLRTLGEGDEPYVCVLGVLVLLKHHKEYALLVEQAIAENQPKKNFNDNNSGSHHLIEVLFNKLKNAVGDGSDKLSCWDSISELEGAFFTWFLPGNEIEFVSEASRKSYGDLYERKTEDQINRERRTQSSYREFVSCFPKLAGGYAEEEKYNKPSVAQIVWARLDSVAKLTWS